MLKNYNCIAAISSPPGKGGVAIIRVSGEGALKIAEKVFVPKGKKPLSEINPRTQIFGNVIKDGQEIDDALLCYFKSPASYTGEDTVEISCHGGSLVTSLVLEALFAAGAEPAAPGEFTKRAMINGKLALTDAEAIANLLEAKSSSQIALNNERSRGLLSSEIAKIRELLRDCLSSMYARIDYPDEDLGDFTSEELSARLANASACAARLKESYKTGRAVNEGIDTVICGKPNAGKSTLYNALIGEERAIVTDIKGTTRDVLSAELPLGKVLLRLSDTAGIRGSSEDKIELIGIERSRKAISAASLIFALFDAESGFSDEDSEIIAELQKSDGVKIAVLNKCDTGASFPKEKLEGFFDALVEISAKENPINARIALTKTVEGLFTDEKISLGEAAVISNARQNASLSRALEFINSAIAALRAGLPQDLASSDIERALGEIAELDGKEVTEEVLNDIFSKFCVGK